MDQKTQRSLSLKQIFSVAFILYFRNIKRFLLISFIISFPIIFLDLFMLYTLGNIPNNAGAGFILLIYLVEALVVIFFPLTLLVLSNETYNHLLKNGAAIEKAFNDSFKRVNLIIGSGLLVYALAIIIEFLFSPLTIWVKNILIFLLSIFLSFYPFVIAFEDLTLIQVMRRSFDLAWINFIKVLVIMIFIIIISPMKLWHYDILAFFQIKPDLGTTVIYSIIETIMLPLQSLLLVIYYFDLRRQLENLNIEIKQQSDCP